MPGLGVRLFTDEMVNPRVAWTLSRLGYDVESCQRAGRANQRISDDDQLLYAAQQRRVILTFNTADFEVLDRRWKAQRRAHAGIIVAEQVVQLAELTRRVQLHLDTISPEDQFNTLLELSR
ncbi:MAG: DUF5615 family PIN-like protein [Chloroflexota bacterium]